MKVHALLFACICLLQCCELGAAEDGGLEMRVRYYMSESGGDRSGVLFGEGRLRYDFDVTFKNVRKELIILPKSGSEPTFSGTKERDGMVYELHYVWDIRTIDKDVPNIPSDSELGLTKLFKGEATRLRFAILTDEKYEVGHFKIKYTVRPKFAVRFGTWSGSLVETPNK